MGAKAKRKAAGPLAAAAALAALFLRAIFLLRRPVWFDEIYTLWISRKPAGEILEVLKFDSGPPLFYLLEKPFVRIAEIFRMDAAARVVPFLALGTLFLLNRRRRFSGGRAFAILLAACPLLFFYSGEARVYGLLAAASFGLFLAVCRAGNARRAFWATAGLSACLPLLHYLGIFVLAGSTLFCLLKRKFRILGALLLGGSVFLFWIPVAAAQPTQALGWARESASSSALGFLEKIGFWGSYPPYFTAARIPAASAGALLGLAVLAGTAFAARRNPPAAEALLFSLLPLLLAALAGLVRPLFFSGRTEMATLPVFLWAAARACRKSIPGRWLLGFTAAAGAAVIVASVLQPPFPGPYSVTAADRVSRSGVRDLTLAAEADYLPLALARDRGRLRGTLIAVPESLASHPGWFEPGVPLPEAEMRRALSAIEGAAPGSRVAIAVPPDPALRPLVSSILRKWGGEVVTPGGGYPTLEIRP
jgi:hypothetical protein